MTFTDPTKTPAKGTDHKHRLTAVDTKVDPLVTRVAALETVVVAQGISIKTLDARLALLETPDVPPVEPPVEPPIEPPAPVDPPVPVEPPATGYDATFTASGNDDATRLRDFVVANRGKHLLLKGTIRTSGGSNGAWTLPAGATTTIDFDPAASLTLIGDATVLYLKDCWDLVVNKPVAVGAGWDGQYITNRQWDHGIQIEGGGRITLNQPLCKNTRGDGIDVDQRDASTAAPVAVVINQPKMFQNGRQNITLNAGQVTVNGGTLDMAGLHNIDMEPNWDSAAKTIDATIKGVSLTRHGSLAVRDNPGDPPITGFAIAGLGYSRATKKAIRITNCTSDKFTLAVDRATTFAFTGNSSVTPVTACGPGPAADTVFAFGMGTATISGNANICVNTTWDLRG